MKGFIKRGAVAFTACTALTGLAGATAATASTHPVISNSTPSCGDACNNLFSEVYGSAQVLNAPVGAWGWRVNLAQFTNSPSAGKHQDFVLSEAGTLGNLIAAGRISRTSYVAQNYTSGAPDFLSPLPVLEEQWEPLGAPSGLCAGVKRGFSDISAFHLIDCGRARSLLVPDIANTDEDTPGQFGVDFFGIPLVLGADTLTTGPLVLTANAAPALRLLLREESLSSHGSAGDRVADTQEWSVSCGPEPFPLCESLRQAAAKG